MQTPLEIIEEFGCPTDSYIRAVHYFRQDYRDLSKVEHEKVIADIIGGDHAPSYDTEKEAELYFLYTVQETVRAFLGGTIPEMSDVWETVQHNMKEFMGKNPWCVKDYQSKLTTEADKETPRRKKGAKGAKAREIYIGLNDGKNDRPTIIQAMIDQAGMTKAGATTYFHNFKKEYGFTGPKTERPKREKKQTASAPKTKGKKRSGPTKGQLAREVYIEMKGSPKKDIIARMVEYAGTSPPGANTYYCACKKELGE